MLKPRNLVAKRSADSTQSYADVVHVAQRTQRTPGELLHAQLVDPGIEHEPRRFFDAFC